MNKDYACDILIDKNVGNFDKMHKLLSTSGLFKNVYLYNGKKTGSFIAQKYKTIRGFMNNKNFLRYSMEEKDYRDIIANNYDEIFIPYFFEVSLGIIKNNKKAVLSMFEDGSGSYIDNVLEPGRGKFYKIMALLCHSPLSYTPLNYYVYDTNISLSNSAINVRAMPEISDEFKSFINKFLEEKDSNRKIIYLTEPLNETNIDLNDYSSFLSYLSHFNDDLVVRMHPRDKDEDYYKQFTFDEKDSLWEAKLLIIRNIENKVLVGRFSTAMFSPKRLYDYEPYLVFTYQLFAKDNNTPIQNYDKAVEDLRACYVNKDKIFIPKSFDELNEVLKKLNK